MASPGLLSDRRELELLFDELATELDHLRMSAEVVMVGGAWLLWHAQRAATRDVDSARRLNSQVTKAIEAVGERHDLQPGWLNDSAAAFWPAGASFGDCQIVYERDALVVRAPAPEVLFVMKLYRADPQDREDMVLSGRCAASPAPRRQWRRSSPDTHKLPMMSTSSTTSSTSPRTRSAIDRMRSRTLISSARLAPSVA